MNPTGIGLGLTICNKILNQFGSHLQIDSIFGEGSTFYFTIELPYNDINHNQRLMSEESSFIQKSFDLRNVDTVKFPYNLGHYDSISYSGMPNKPYHPNNI